ncbi:SDR family NAD(P)-dependent oxidoreductase [Halovenus rubra]|uniref:SDR family NAD(P)-dependent oxidoreductase n=2 Tax=Halovenus rubra TaxID=869890 RepID=A0ACC7DYY2_9EURY|nr:SDR family oxidoreductase [Halovenus rubra]
MDGKTVVITGASRGIGQAVAAEVAKAGAHVVICARSADSLEKSADEIRDAGGTVTTKRVDVRDEYDVEHLMEIAASEGGTIDAVIANAGVYHGETGHTPLQEESYTALDDHINTNARGVFATLREAIPHLADDATLLVTSGVVARGTAEGVGSYAVSKAAAEAVARGFAADTEYDVGVIDPGLVATELNGPNGHEPEDVAEQFRWALEEAPADDLDGSVIDRRTFRKAQRDQ